MKNLNILYYFFLIVLIVGCSNEKIGLPTVPSDLGFGNIGEEVYVQLTPVWDINHGLDLNTPSDIHLGLDNFLYVADTGKNRILMLDISGAIQGVLTGIENPLAITQDNLLNLFIVNGTNRIFKIDLVSNNHNINNAQIDTVHERSQNTSLVYRGITSYFFDNKHKIYTVAVDNDDADYGDIIDFEFRQNNPVQTQLIRLGPLPLFHDGQGLYVVKQPTCIRSQREGYLDFLFGQVGNNNFLVQGVRTLGSGNELTMGANTNFTDTDLYTVNKFLYPTDIEINNAGIIFVLDSQTDAQHPYNFYRFNHTGLQTQAFGGIEMFGEGNNLLPLNNPKGLAVTYGGQDPTVYIADSGNNRILLFKLNTDLN